MDRDRRGVGADGPQTEGQPEREAVVLQGGWRGIFPDLLNCDLTFRTQERNLPTQ